MSICVFMVGTDLPTLPHWAEAFRISRPASDLPHLLKIFRFHLKSDRHVFPVWTPMQLTWQSTSYHDHSSPSCPLISWGTVKTETLPALCNKNNKPIDLIHLRCGWQLTLLRERKGIWCLRKMFPTKLCASQKMCLSQTCTLFTVQTQTGTEIVTLKFLKTKANKIVFLMHVIKMYLQRMALFLRMINTWWFDTWTWPSGMAVDARLRCSINHVYCY